MRAAVFHSPGLPFTIESVDDPVPGDHEVVVKVLGSGVCGSDLHATSGHGRTFAHDSLIGHEFAGEVVALGAKVETLRIGDRVAGLPMVGCGECAACATGIDLLCTRRTAYTAAMAEFALVGERGAVKLTDAVSGADGALVEPLAVGRRAVRLAAPTADTRTLVMGPGPIGLAVLFWLRREGVRNVAVLGASKRRRDLVAAMSDAQFFIEGDDAKEQIESAIGGEPQLIFDCVGAPGVLARAIGLAAPAAQIISLGFCMLPDEIIPGRALLKDLTMRFSTTYTRDDFASCGEALAENAVATLARSMVTDVVTLDEFPAAFERFREGKTGAGKLIATPWTTR